MGFAFDDTGMPVLVPEESNGRVIGNGHSPARPQWTTLAFDPDAVTPGPITSKVGPQPAQLDATNTQYAGLRPLPRPAPGDHSESQPPGGPAVAASGPNEGSRPVQRQTPEHPTRDQTPPPVGFLPVPISSNASERDSAPSQDEIGGLLVEVERFAEEALADAKQRAQAIVDSATQHANSIIERAMQQASEATAAAAADQSTIDKYERQAREHGQKIVDSAQAHADAIVEQARRHAEELTRLQSLPFPEETVIHLCTAIEEFADMNRMLVSELTSLRIALANWLGRDPGQVRNDPAAAVFEAALRG